MNEQIKSVIFDWLRGKLSDEKIIWLQPAGEILTKEPDQPKMFTFFSSVPRYTGKGKAGLTEEQLNRADSIRKGWDPSEWTLDQLARTWLVLCYNEHEKAEFLDMLEKLFISSDLGEAVALYQSLPLYPYPESLAERTIEGVRSNITSVFNAIALKNPYICEHLDQEAWNQIVLKAMFVGSPLYKIRGLDQRNNKTLARILVDYAHERRSAGRVVSPELWRPVGPFIDDWIAEDLRWVLSQPEILQKQAGVLALRSSDYPGADELLEGVKDTVKEIDEKKINWDDVGRQYKAEK